MSLAFILATSVLLSTTSLAPMLTSENERGGQFLSRSGGVLGEDSLDEVLQTLLSCIRVNKGLSHCEVFVLPCKVVVPILGHVVRLLPSSEETDLVWVTAISPSLMSTRAVIVLRYSQNVSFL